MPLIGTIYRASYVEPRMQGLYIWGPYIGALYQESIYRVVYNGCISVQLLHVNIDKATIGQRALYIGQSIVIILSCAEPPQSRHDPLLSLFTPYTGSMYRATVYMVLYIG